MNEQQRMARPLSETDPEVFQAIQQERDRQDTRLELIASENFTSEAVMEATGSVFTNKYAEGYPGKRYYQGCAPSDEVEQLAIDRAKQLFGCGFANVQPHSGAQANGAVMLALVKPTAPARLRELLEAVAVYAVGGSALLEDKRAVLPGAALLLRHLKQP